MKPFYGWVVVGATATILTAAYGASYTFGVFLPWIQADTGWDRELLTRPYALYVFAYGVLSFATGWCTDRFGPRRVMTAGGIFLAAGYTIFSRAESEWQLFLGLGGVAAAGMSAAFVPCAATVVRWFVRGRGRALGMATMGASLGNIAVPPIAAALVEAIGWRNAYALVGWGTGAVVVLAAQFVVRDPAAMHLQPDGAPAPLPLSSEAGRRASDANAERAWSFEEARRTRSFWLLTAIFFSSWLVVFLPVVHLSPYALDLGLSTFDAAWLLSGIGLGGALGRPLMGAISDRLGRIPALAAVLATESAAFLVFPASHEWGPLMLGAIAFGFAYGGGTSLFSALVGDFYGREAAGAIVGFVFAIAGSAAAFGPWLAGYVVSATGSYDLAFWIGAAANGIALLGVAFLRRPEAPEAEFPPIPSGAM